MSSFLARVRDRRGQTLVELAIVIFTFVLLMLGIVELGRAFMIANVVTHATRDGARSAAVVPAAGRDASGRILDPSPIRQQVLGQIGNIMNNGSMSVTIDQLGTIPPVVKVKVTGPVPLLFSLPGIGGSFTLTREVTFRDEGR
jgi:Flp pilus assembly protein TadG